MAAPPITITAVPNGQNVKVPFTSQIFGKMHKENTTFNRFQVAGGTSHVVLAYSNGILWADSCSAPKGSYRISELVAHFLAQIGNPRVEHYIITNIAHQPSERLLAQTMTSHTRSTSWMYMDGQTSAAAYELFLSTSVSPFIPQARNIGNITSVFITSTIIVFNFVTFTPPVTPDASQTSVQVASTSAGGYYPPQQQHRSQTSITAAPVATPPPHWVDGVAPPPHQHNQYCGMKQNGKWCCWA